jgi:hypothetical protein
MDMDLTRRATYLGLLSLLLRFGNNHDEPKESLKAKIELRNSLVTCLLQFAEG